MLSFEFVSQDDRRRYCQGYVKVVKQGEIGVGLGGLAANYANYANYTNGAVRLGCAHWRNWRLILPSDTYFRSHSLTFADFDAAAPALQAGLPRPCRRGEKSYER